MSTSVKHEPALDIVDSPLRLPLLDKVDSVNEVDILNLEESVSTDQPDWSVEFINLFLAQKHVAKHTIIDNA